VKDAVQSVEKYGFGLGGVSKPAKGMNEFRSSEYNSSGAACGPVPLGMDGNTHVVPPQLHNDTTREIF